MTTLAVGWYQEREIGYVNGGPKCSVFHADVADEDIERIEQQAINGLRHYPLRVLVWIPDEMTNYFYRAKFAPALRELVGKRYEAGVRGTLTVERETIL